MKSREKILLNCKEPITIKDLRKKTGLKWANLSRHLTRLREKGWIIDVGRDGRSKVIQLNKYKYNEDKRDEFNMLKQILK